MKFQTAILLGATLAGYTPFVSAVPSSSIGPSASASLSAKASASASAVASTTPIVQAQVSSEAKASAVCGDLGVLDTDAVPASPSTKPDEVRLCKEHPLAGENLHNGTSQLGKRACWYDEPWGCTRGYCWKKCSNDGSWCWGTNPSAWGPWVRCKEDKDCYNGWFNCAAGDKNGCGSCGCGCW